MRILVTGVTGFIGSNLVKRLLKEGWKVKALVRAKNNYATIKKLGVDIFIGDITDSKSVQEATKGVDVLFNCAAALPYHRFPDKDYWEVNVKGVENILKACYKSGVKRVVHISTVGIYGRTGKMALNEEALPKPNDIYSKTKFEGEKLVWREIKRGHLHITIIRPTIGYGPGDTRPGFLDLFKLIKMGIFVPIGKGENFFHTVYVGNLVDALLLVATKKEAIGEDFVIGDEPCPTMDQIIREIARVENVSISSLYIPDNIALFLGRFFDLSRVLGLPAPLNSRRVKFMTENKRFSIEKAKKILGYKPRITLREGIKRTFEWYRKERYI